MNVRDTIRKARLDLPTLAELTGGHIRLPFLKQLSRGAKEANDEHRAALAAALRKHSRTLDTLADSLDPPA